MISLKAIFLPMILGLAAFQINTFMDAVMAMGFSAHDDKAGLAILGHLVRYPLQEAAVAALGWSQRLYEFPLGIFGIAIATAIFPALSHAAAQKGDLGRQRFTRLFHHGLRLSVFIGLPASAGLLIVALPLSRLAYERGQFGLEDSARVAWILMGYAPAIWAYSMNHVLTRAFYAQGDSRTPLGVALAMVLLNLSMNLILVWSLGAQGFALATASSAIVQSVILLRTMDQMVGQRTGRDVWLSWGRTLLATLVMSALLTPVAVLFHPASLSHLHNALLLAGLVIAGGLVFMAMAQLLGCEEMKWLIRRKPGV
jgi:putative peptidoglycan lipid II flippase